MGCNANAFVDVGRTPPPAHFYTHGAEQWFDFKIISLMRTGQRQLLKYCVVNKPLIMDPGWTEGYQGSPAPWNRSSVESVEDRVDPFPSPLFLCVLLPKKMYKICEKKQFLS